MDKTKIIYESSNGKRRPLSNIRYENEIFQFYMDKGEVVLKHEKLQ